MPKFAANLSFLYPQLPFLDRFAAAAADGFKGVECLFPYDLPVAEVQARLRAHGLEQVLFNVSAGDWVAGERGLAGRPTEVARFRAAFGQALEWAQALSCRRLHVMAGCVDGDPAAHWATFESNLRWAAPLAAAQGVSLLVEPLNPRDMPGYLFSRQAEAHALCERLGEPNVAVQMDLYHCQIVEGDLTRRMQTYLPTGRVGHMQLAGVPDRQEPDTGELQLDHLLDTIDATGYTGWVGCEYRPAADTSEGLAWLRRYRSRRANGS